MKKHIAIFLSVMFVLGMLVSCSENKPKQTVAGTPSTHQETPATTCETTPLGKVIFNTNNIISITFYGYYGTGTGSKVPDENMSEYISWLGSFTIDKKADDNMPAPGTNTYYVKIEYSDGTIVKEGLDAMNVDGTLYYLKHATYPDSFMDIISKTSA